MKLLAIVKGLVWFISNVTVETVIVTVLQLNHCEVFYESGALTIHISGCFLFR